MTIRDLVPASQLADRFGVKGICYGPPGSGKTPLINTASEFNPVLCVTEPGMLSMKSSKIQCRAAFTLKEIDDFIAWMTSSTEVRNFGLVAFDSISQIAELELAEQQSKTKDGRQAYGRMSENMMSRLHKLYFLQNLNILLIAKEDVGNGSNDGSPTAKTRPLFPGQDLKAKIPHLFDWVFRLATESYQGWTGRCVRSIENYQYFARERTGKLSEIEQPDLNYLLKKLSV